MLSKSQIKRLVSKGVEGNEYHISGMRAEAVDYLVEKTEEFVQNLARNSVEEMKVVKKKYITKEVLQRTLNRLDMVLKNIPRA